MTLINYQSKYETKFNLEYNDALKQFEKILNKKDKLQNTLKLQTFHSIVIKEIHNLKNIDIRHGSYKEDPYINLLIYEFNKRTSNYSEDDIELFLKHDLKEIKNRFINKQEEILKPQIYNLKKLGTLLFLAKINALQKLSQQLDKPRISPSNNTSEIIYWVKNGKSITETDVKIDNSNTNPINLKWKESNETEFIHFAYALFNAEYLKNESNQKTKLVEELAKVFNFDLGSNWQSNFSKSIHERNNGYEPPIFEKLRKACQAHINQKNESKRKKK